MKFTKTEKSAVQTGIKRRNFLGYLGISAVGVFLLSKFPGKLFSSKINQAVSQNKTSIVVKENPNAVKRIAITPPQPSPKERELRNDKSNG